MADVFAIQSQGSTNHGYNFEEDTNFASNTRSRGRRKVISVQSAEKSYGSKKVLHGVSMILVEGTMYGFLGASGSGKTTLISAIVGLRKLDFGKILVLGREPNEAGSGVPGRLIGYMPQELGLNGEFRIREVAHFFGSLYGMENRKIEERLKELLQLLDLKDSNQYLKHMSGGQARRVSFLVALLHQPKIMILDEPTAGLEPVIRMIMWNHLRSLVQNQGATVLITTHYVEEMRYADKVGIMQDGRIMVEASPQALMATQNVSTLEEVVLKYCPGEDSAQENITAAFSESGPAQRHVERVERSPAESDYSSTIDLQTRPWNRVYALTQKNFIVLKRRVGSLFFTFFCPAFIVWVYCVAIGSDPKDVNLGVVNQENGSCRSGVYTILQKELLSCSFLYLLQQNSTFNLIYYTNERDGVQGVRDGSTIGYVHFKPNFSQNIYKRIIQRELSNETIDGSTINFRLDMTTTPMTQFIRKRMLNTYQVFAQNLVSVFTTISVEGHELPITFGKPYFGSDKTTFRDYLAPGICMTMIGMFSLLTCGLGFISEKKEMMMERTKVAGVSTFETMVSFLAPQLGVVVIQFGFSFIIMFILFDIPHEGSLLLALALGVAFSLSGVSAGFLLSSMVDDEKNAILLGIGFMTVTLVLSGVVFPLQTFPPIFTKLGWWFPGGMSCEGFRSILLRGSGISNYSVQMGILSPLIYMLIYSIVTLFVLKIRT